LGAPLVYQGFLGAFQKIPWRRLQYTPYMEGVYVHATYERQGMQERQERQERQGGQEIHFCYELLELSNFF